MGKASGGGSPPPPKITNNNTRVGLTIANVSQLGKATALVARATCH